LLIQTVQTPAADGTCGVAQKGAEVSEQREFPVSEVTRFGFEARCIGPGGARYLWHDGCGLRVDPRTLAVTLVTDPSRLPEGPAIATRLGEQELVEGVEG
jgi:hypothetical protein